MKIIIYDVSQKRYVEVMRNVTYEDIVKLTDKYDNDIDIFKGDRPIVEYHYPFEKETYDYAIHVWIRDEDWEGVVGV